MPTARTPSFPVFLRLPGHILRRYEAEAQRQTRETGMEVSVQRVIIADLAKLIEKTSAHSA